MRRRFRNRRRFSGARRKFRKLRKAVHYAVMPLRGVHYLGRAFFAALGAKHGPLPR
jgi:hypothetical protein